MFVKNWPACRNLYGCSRVLRRAAFGLRAKAPTEGKTMSKKLLLALAACLPIALSGCGGSGGGTSCTVNGIGISCDDYPRMSQRVQNWNNALEDEKRAGPDTTAKLATASRTRSASDISAASAAVDEYEKVVQALIAEDQRSRSENVPDDGRRADALRIVRNNLNNFQTRLGRLTGGSGSNGGGAGGGGAGGSEPSTPARPKDFTAGIDGMSSTDGMGRRNGNLYINYVGGNCTYALFSGYYNCGDGYTSDSIMGRIFDDRRLRDSYMSLATINAIKFYISDHSLSNGQFSGYVERNIAAWGQYAVILSSGRFDCPDNCSNSTQILGFDLGNRNINTPSLSGRWRGAMAATDISTGSAVVGEAYVTFDASIFGHDTGRYRIGVNTPPDVTVQFRNIRKIDDGIDGQTAAYSGPTRIDWNLETTTRFGWFGIPTETVDGRNISYGYGSGEVAHPSSGIITGYFYGPDTEDAQEVAGVFEYYYGGQRLEKNRRMDGIVGAYLTKRQ